MFSCTTVSGQPHRYFNYPRHGVALLSTQASNHAAVADGRLMARIKAGSVDALGVLYDRYCDRAYRVARSICRDEGFACDAVQEAFIAIWQSRASYEDRGNVAAWVLGITRYRAIDIARRNDMHAARRAREHDLHSVRAPSEVAEHVHERIVAHSLQALLAALPDTQREVITLAFFGELTHTEIASHLDLPLGTVKGRMRLGLQRLRGDIQRVVAG